MRIQAALPPVIRLTKIQIYKYTNIQIYKYTNTQILYIQMSESRMVHVMVRDLRRLLYTNIKKNIQILYIYTKLSESGVCNG